MPKPSPSSPSAPAAPAGELPLLSVRDLAVEIDTDRGTVPLLDAVSFDLPRGSVTGLVGESGSGKTLTALAVLGLLPPAARVVAGSIHLAGRGELTGLSARCWRGVRGRAVGMIFQEPRTALNPILTIGYQIAESLRLHHGLSRRQARRRGEELLRRVAMPDPEERWRSFPHQLSGGQLQRAMIALALAPGPDLLLADEPTTALDVTVQAQVLELLADLQRQLELTVLLITHDLAVVAETCDRMLVMDHGRLVERGSVRGVFARPDHDVTRGLLAAAGARPAGESA